MPELAKTPAPGSSGNPGNRAENYLAPETLAQLAPFELRAKMIVEGVMSGMHRSPYQGMAVEFAQHRQYVAGDDLKHLDWKVYGRSDKLYIKQYQQETNLDVIMLIDASASMSYGTLGVKKGWGGTSASKRKNAWTKFDHATAVAVAVAYLCLQQQDRVGVAVFADEIRAMVKRSSSRGQWKSIVNTLNVQPVDAKTNLAKVTDQALGKVHNRALFVIISDFFEDIEAVRQSLARFRHRRHDVILLQVLDRQELQFEFTQPAPFEGMEDEGRLKIDPRALRRAYLEAISSHMDAIAKAALSFGFDYLRLNTHESVGPALSYLLARRNAQVKRSKIG
ncbi:MAG: DUF58 domain-containing protein [Phycisphaerales bacterium]|nr:DUF58 domain-containing protein [Phycisphaerales bacterium]MCI0676242.1 DUF58 domain-containing protein [Phycisphaerales bacterium]